MTKVFVLATVLLATSLQCLHAAPPGFQGVDPSGKPCHLSFSANDTIYMKTGNGYEFYGINVVPTEHTLAFDQLTIQRGPTSYSPPIGAPITIGNIGMLQVTGEVRMDASGMLPAQFTIRAVGGIANWWRATFRCSRKEP